MAKATTTKKAAKTPAKKTATKSKKTASTAGGKFRLKVRMYCQGLGDCFLLTLPGKGGKKFYVLIDCGVILGTEDASNKMAAVVQDIIKETGGEIDLLAATHEHWDHVSGWVQTRDLWNKKDAKGADKSKLTVKTVWLGWTEDPKDNLAKKLKKDRASTAAALATAACRMQMSGSRAAAEVTNLIEFFGASGANSTAAAMDEIKSLTNDIRYCLPTDDPVDLADGSVTAFVLGPPHDEQKIKKINPSKKDQETYGLAEAVFMTDVAMALMNPAPDGIFDQAFQIPLAEAKSMPFFQTHYWGEDGDSDEKDQSWRRIDGTWLDSSSSMALALDSATNNTSLVLAFELDGGDVLLFAADAQVGNWLSWQDLSWKVGGKQVTGPDLLKRTVFYKVGHHGSHNATLQTLGLEEMEGLKLAFLPVDEKMAVKKRWGKMPLPELLDRLKEKTKDCVVRIDQELPAKLVKSIDEVKDGNGKRLYLEVAL